MARRSDHTKTEIRQMVIKSGSKLISETGFSNFSTRKIAKEIKYSVGTLYNVFDSYDDIILHINCKTLVKMKKFLKKNINVKLETEDYLIQVAQTYLNFVGKNYNNWSAIFEYIPPTEYKIPDWYLNEVDSLFQIVAKGLEKIIKNKSEAQKHAKIIWASIHGICILNLSKKLNTIGIISVESSVNMLINNYLRGIKNVQ